MRNEPSAQRVRRRARPSGALRSRSRGRAVQGAQPEVAAALRGGRRAPATSGSAAIDAGAQRLGRERHRLAAHHLPAGSARSPRRDEQVEHDVGAEPGGADAEPGVAGRVGEPPAVRGAEEGAEPAAGVDDAAPRVGEAQAGQLRERRRRSARRACANVAGRAGRARRVIRAAVVVDGVVAAPQDPVVGGEPVVVELVAGVADALPAAASRSAASCAAESGSVISA